MQNAKVEPAKCSSHSSESESDPQQIPAHFENSSSTVDSTSNQIFTQATYEAPPKVKKRMKTSDVDFNKEKTNLIVNYLPQVRSPIQGPDGILADLWKFYEIMIFKEIISWQLAG